MDADVRSFITSAFPSVWSLELLLQLKASPERAFTAEELVTTLRASDVVVTRSGQALIAAGLVVEEAEGALRYAPASPELDSLATRAEDVYRLKPDKVRRAIVGATPNELNAFADAFKLRRDK